MLAALYAQLDEYKSFQSAVSGAIPTLSPAIENTATCSSAIESFKINDSRADNSSIEDCKNDLISVSNTMSGAILPAISSKIAEINASIAAELARIAAETEAAASKKK